MTVAALAHKIWQERKAREAAPVPTKTVPETPEVKGEHRAKAVEIRTTVDHWTYRIVVIVDGKVQSIEHAQHFEVVRKRNAHCERWSEQADTVTANDIPKIAVLQETPA